MRIDSGHIEVVRHPVRHHPQCSASAAWFIEQDYSAAVINKYTLIASSIEALTLADVALYFKAITVALELLRKSVPSGRSLRPIAFNRWPVAVHFL